jgi:hypothetical protein
MIKSKSEKLSKKIHYTETHVFIISKQKTVVKFNVYQYKKNYFAKENDISFYTNDIKDTYFLIAANPKKIENPNILRIINNIGKLILKTVFIRELNLIVNIKQK